MSIPMPGANAQGEGAATLDVYVTARGERAVSATAAALGLTEPDRASLARGEALRRALPARRLDLAQRAGAYVTPVHRGQNTNQFVELESSAQFVAQSGGGLEFTASQMQQSSRPADPPSELVRSKRTCYSLRSQFKQIYDATGPTLGLAEATGDYFRMRLKGPMTHAFADYLAAEGVRVDGFRGGTYQIYLSQRQKERLTAHEYVTGLELYTVFDTVTTQLLIDREQTGERREQTMHTLFDVSPHRAESVEQLTQELAQLPGVTIVDSCKYGIRVRAAWDDTVIRSIIARPLVKSVMPFKPGKLFDRTAAGVVGADRCTPLPTPGGVMLAAFEGSGQIVGVLDSGADSSHPDLAGQIVSECHIYNRFDDGVVPGAEFGSIASGGAEDRNGHGTHVTGTIVGTGAASGGAWRGVAPAAKAVLVRIATARGDLLLGLDATSALEAARDRGAKVINCSFGNLSNGVYDLIADSVDDFARLNPDILIIVAAGNEGAVFENKYAALGQIRSPACCKNVLTVGACGNAYACADPAPLSFNDLTKGRITGPFAVEFASPNIDYLVPTSSCGPTSFYSVKPDVVAPGTYVVAPKAKNFDVTRLPPGNPPPPFADTPTAAAAVAQHYVFMHGTSMATPIVSGCALLLREYLSKVRACDSPSSALLKSLLILSAQPLAKTPPHHPSTPEIGYPNFDWGFGRVDLTSLIPGLTGAPPGRKLAFCDVANEPGAGFMLANAPGVAHAHSYLFTVKKVVPAPLRVCLVWLDPHGAALRNDLALMLECPLDQGDGAMPPPGTGVIRGNHEHRFLSVPGMTVGSRETKNNVEIIRLPNAAAGEYCVNVLAANITAPPQGYALAVVGELESDVLLRI